MVEKVADLNVFLQTLTDLKTFLFGGLFAETLLVLVTLERARRVEPGNSSPVSHFDLDFLQLFEKFFDTFDLSDHFRVFGQGFFLVFVQFFSRLRFGFVTFEFLLEREIGVERKTSEMFNLSFAEIALFLLENENRLSDPVEIQRRRISRWRRSGFPVDRGRLLLLNIGH